MTSPLAVASRLETTTLPAQLALTSWLHGGPLPSPEPPRVLQIGCGDGVNLVPLAFYDRKGFYVGLDTDPEAIARGSAAAQELGLRHLRFEQVESGRLAASLDRGRFDFIFVLDLFSWVSEDLRDELLALCRDHLAPNGLVNLSMATHAAWSQRSVVRELLRREVEGIDDELERLRRARALAGKLRAPIPNETPHAHAAVMAGELDMALNATDEYLRREYLSRENRGFLLSEMVERLERFDLHYVADARFNFPEARSGEELRPILERQGLEGMALSDAVDAVTCRQLRHALVCREDARPPPQFGPEVLRGMHVTSNLAPVAEEFSYEPGIAMVFADGEAKVGTESALVKAALVLLHETSPRARRVSELTEAAQGMLGPQGITINNRDRLELYRTLIDLHAKGFVGLVLREPVLPATTWIAHELARWEATHRPFLTTIYHTPVTLDGFMAQVVRRLDGTREHETIIGELVALVEAGELRLIQNETPITGGEQIDATVRAMFAENLGELSRWGLLSGASPGGVP